MSRPVLSFPLLFGILAGLPDGSRAQEPDLPPVLIQDVTVIDGTGAAPRGGMSVLVEDGRVAALGPAESIEGPPAARVVDGRGRFLIPGLWDLHTHLSKARATALPLLVHHGVLGVRDVGGDLEELRRWRRQIRAGERVGPRIVMAGPYLESATNVLRVLMQETVEPEERTRIPIADPPDARRVVDSLATIGVDFLKVRTWPDLASFRAIAETAAARGVPLAAHTFGLPPEILREGLVASVEHFYPVPDSWDAAERGAFYRDLAEAGTVVVPTAVNIRMALVPADSAARIVRDSAGTVDPMRPYVSAFLLADWAEQLEERTDATVAWWSDFYPSLLTTYREMHAAGVRLLPGSDLAVLLVHPGASLHRELEIFVTEIGMKPMEALVAATSGATAFLGLADSVGTIEPGKVADLVLLEADPLADITNTREIAVVIQGGRVYGHDDLERLRASVRAMPEIRENDWLPAAPSSELSEAIAIERSLDTADAPGAVAAAIERFERMEGAESLPGGPAALGARIEAAVNRAGYRFLEEDRVDSAVAVFEMNAAAFPESSNVWDSLAEAHLAQGDREKAIELYRKSLELDPDNDNAREKLEELGAGG